MEDYQYLRRIRYHAVLQRISASCCFPMHSRNHCRLARHSQPASSALGYSAECDELQPAKVTYVIA
jgi:hypothetical protein